MIEVLGNLLAELMSPPAIATVSSFLSSSFFLLVSWFLVSNTTIWLKVTWLLIKFSPFIIPWSVFWFPLWCCCMAKEPNNRRQCSTESDPRLSSITGVCACAHKTNFFSSFYFFTYHTGNWLNLLTLRDGTIPCITLLLGGNLTQGIQKLADIDLQHNHTNSGTKNGFADFFLKLQAWNHQLLNHWPSSASS